MITKPRPLPPGGVIGIISPASPVDPVLLNNGVRLLQARGYTVRVAPHALDKQGHLAGQDIDRACDFQQFYSDPEIDMVWCSRGGSSSCRLWTHLDWVSLAALPPKLLVGYSDITSLQIPLYDRCGVPSLYGQMVSRLDALSGDLLDWQLSLMSPHGNEISVPCAATDFIVIGNAEGRLAGGCLSLVAATVGTPYQVDTEGSILFLEDIDSRP